MLRAGTAHQSPPGTASAACLSSSRCCRHDVVKEWIGESEKAYNALPTEVTLWPLLVLDGSPGLQPRHQVSRCAGPWTLPLSHEATGTPSTGPSHRDNFGSQHSMVLPLRETVPEEQPPPQNLPKKGGITGAEAFLLDCRLMSRGFAHAQALRGLCSASPIP